MRFLYPKPPNSPTIPQWWVFSFEINPRLQSLSMLWRLGPVSVQLQFRTTDDGFSRQSFARPTRFYVIRLNNGPAKILKLICVDCGLEYPCPPDLASPALCDCTLSRKTCVVLWWKRNPRPRTGELLYERSREFAL